MACIVQWGFIRKPQLLDAYELEWTYVLRNTSEGNWVVQLSATYREPVDVFGDPISDDDFSLSASVAFAEDRSFCFVGGVEGSRKERAFGRKSVVLQQKVQVLRDGALLLKGKVSWEVKCGDEDVEVMTTPFSIEFLCLPPIRPFFKLS